LKAYFLKFAFLKAIVEFESKYRTKIACPESSDYTPHQIMNSYRAPMKIIFTLFALLLSSFIHASSLNKIVVLGDSLSDNGNLYKLYKIPSSPPYFEGRFSNGPIWAELLADSYYPENGNSHLFDMAFGGAAIAEDEDDAIFSLKFEIDTYLGAHQAKADKDSLFVIWIGGNNYLMTPSDVDETLGFVNRGIRNGVKKLIDAGAKHIMLINLPDLGMAPLSSEFYSEKNAVTVKDQLSFYCKRHNELLLQTYNELKQANPEIELLHFDAGSKFKEIMAAPQNYGIENTTDACYSAKFEKTTNNLILALASTEKLKREGSCDSYLFFDAVHPSAKAHKMIANEVRAYLDAEGVIFGD
jgi:phospholipase/lecithinase/hemolysin